MNPITSLTSDFLYENYIIKKMSSTKISELAGCSKPTVLKYLKIHDILVRNGSESHKGLKTRLGTKHTEEQRKNISLGRKGKLTGKNHPNWKGGITSLITKIRGSREYVIFRTNVFIRDNYTCQMCSRRGCRLNADHIKPFSKIMKEYNITSIESAFSCDELWDMNNLRTLCEPCHKKTDTYGGKKKNV